ncbi:MAG: hypothetical protein HEP70_08215 [Rhodobiaceae bacterium]|nr:hypothetical protein [Rhodobiaceae bacterium]
MLNQPNSNPIALRLIRSIAQCPDFIDLAKGESTHGPALNAVNALLSVTNDGECIKQVVSAALPERYKGNTLDELDEMISSGVRKGIGSKPLTGLGVARYEPGVVGPVPLGYREDGSNVFYDQNRNILSVESATRLFQAAVLIGFAPSDFWSELYPRFKDGKPAGIETRTAGEALIVACRDMGGFDASLVRGRGVYLDADDNTVVNWGDNSPNDDRHVYVCHRALDAVPRTKTGVTAQKVFDLFDQFNWNTPSAPYLLLGWAVVAVICGALDWRPHLFLTGAKNTGKSTLVAVLQALLYPIAIVLDGQSSEAGIRQTIGADSRPVLLDEFEADQNRGRMRQVIKLMRSASSGDMPVVRGTPEGKAIVFSIRSTFLLAAINPFAVTAADHSRIVVLSLDKHDNDREKAAQIRQLKSDLAKSGPEWCHLVINHVDDIRQSIETLEAAFPAVDSRHAKNMATLLAGAWVSINGRAINEVEAGNLIAEHDKAINMLAEAHDEDDSFACLSALLEYQVPDDTVLGLLQRATGRRKGHDREQLMDVAKSELERLGLRVVDYKLLVPNSHRGMTTIFAGTLWEGGGWASSLGRLPGAQRGSQRRFSGQQRSLCTELDLGALLDGLED